MNYYIIITSNKAIQFYDIKESLLSLSQDYKNI